ncbi:MAG: hypothetical protein ACKPCP_23945, partial [Sphaerospermopsis kisseleviana]
LAYFITPIRVKPPSRCISTVETPEFPDVRNLDNHTRVAQLWQFCRNILKCRESGVTRGEAFGQVYWVKIENLSTEC